MYLIIYLRYPCSHHLNNSCSLDTCDEFGSCTNTMQNNCCGNYVCEDSESALTCSDCGPFILDSGFCSSCYGLWTFMFDVEAINDVLISSLTMQFYNGTSEVSIFTASDGFIDKITEENSWTQIFNSSYTSSDSAFHLMRMNT